MRRTRGETTLSLRARTRTTAPGRATHHSPRVPCEASGRVTHFKKPSVNKSIYTNDQKNKDAQTARMLVQCASQKPSGWSRARNKDLLYVWVAQPGSNHLLGWASGSILWRHLRNAWFTSLPRSIHRGTPSDMPCRCTRLAWPNSRSSSPPSAGRPAAGLRKTCYTLWRSGRSRPSPCRGQPTLVCRAQRQATRW